MPARTRSFAFAVFAVLIHALPAAADDFPKGLVEWTPLADKPVFQGAGGDAWDRKIRERGYILVEGDTFHLWYTGYNDDRSPRRLLGHATSADGLRWSRDPANPIFSGSWTEDVFVMRRDGRYFMFAEGEKDVAHQLTSADPVHWTDEGALDVRKADGSPIPPGPYGTPHRLVRGRHLLPLLRTRGPGRLARDLQGPPRLDERQGRAGPRDGA